MPAAHEWHTAGGQLLATGMVSQNLPGSIAEHTLQWPLSPPSYPDDRSERWRMAATRPRNACATSLIRSRSSRGSCSPASSMPRPSPRRAGAGGARLRRVRCWAPPKPGPAGGRAGSRIRSRSLARGRRFPSTTVHPGYGRKSAGAGTGAPFSSRKRETNASFYLS
jgi:hypothetical protein